MPILSQMAKTTRIYWFAPTSMVTGLSAGILLALGHHLFYASLAGTHVTEDSQHSVLGFEISSQQWNTAVGMAFAFIVKACLLFAVAVGYAQVFWQAIRHSQKVNTLGDIDAMFSSPSNLLAFGRWAIWWRHPWLLLIVLIGW